MSLKRMIVLLAALVCSYASAAEFTIGSYNCGGLSHHYDYLRAASMQKIMKERYEAEPSIMALNQDIQKLSAKIIFGDVQEKHLAQQEWIEKDYPNSFDTITASPRDENEINYPWFEKANSAITNYKVRPVEIY